MDNANSPVEALVEAVQSALFARRAALTDRVLAVERCLENYRRAVETQIARGFADEHGFKLPAPPALSAERAAELLRAAVSALPELQSSSQTGAKGVQSPTPAKDARPVAQPAAAKLEPNPALGAKIVVIGALSGRDKAEAVPPAFADSVEWVDTEREGAHAVGNLPQRLRQGRVAGIIILDRAVKHRHTEPVVAAAREAGVPVAFAGQGGRASLARAFSQLEVTLSSAPEK